MKYIKTFNEASIFQEEIAKLNKKFISDKYDIMESNKKIIEDCFMHVSDLCETKIESATTVIDHSFMVDINILNFIIESPETLPEVYRLIEESLEKCYIDLDTSSQIILISGRNGDTTPRHLDLDALKTFLNASKSTFTRFAHYLTDAKIRIILR